MTERRLEPYVVESVMHLGDNLALVSSNGTVICRATKEFSRIPEIGNHLELETLDGLRVTGLKDGDTWLFRYSDQNLADQDRALHAAYTETSDD